MWYYFQLLFFFLTLTRLSEGKCVAQLNTSMTTTTGPFRNCLFTIGFNWKVADNVVPLFSGEVAHDGECSTHAFNERRTALVIYTHDTKFCQIYGVGAGYDMTTIADWPPARLNDAWVNTPPCGGPSGYKDRTFNLASGESYKYVEIDKSHSKIVPVP